MSDPFDREKRSQIMAAVRSKDTTPELVVRRLTHAMGYRYRLHVRGLAGTPDLVFPRLRRIIDVRGCFWHGHSCGRCRIPASRRDYWLEKIERNKARDRRTVRTLRRDGWKVLIIWECQSRSAAIERLRSTLRRFLSS